MKAAHRLCTATFSTTDIKEELNETAVRNWLHRAECFWRRWQVLSWSRIWSPECYLMNRAVNKTYHKWTLTADPSCLSATWNCMHVPRPLCYRQHTATGDLRTACGSCCWRYRRLSMVCVCYLWRDWLFW